MSKVYIVKGKYVDESGLSGWTEAAFSNYDRAEVYRSDLEASEEFVRENVSRCRDCDGDNPKCPYYIAPFHFDDGCEGRQLFHRNEEYFVEEVEVIE